MKNEEKEKERQQELEDKIEEFQHYLRKHRQEKENRLKELAAAKARAYQAFQAEWNLKMNKVESDLNPKIHDDINVLNASAIALEDLEDSSDEEPTKKRKKKRKKKKDKELFCKICFERDELKKCGECNTACCEACWVECDREKCKVVFCKPHRDKLHKVMQCGVCEFCLPCKVKYGAERHEKYCVK